MEIWEEPVRGEPLAPAAFTLDGLERLRGWGRFWPVTPMVHHLGLRVTQVVSGSAVASLPVTPWLMHPDGVVEVGFLADTVCGIAADTVLKPRTIVVPLHSSYRPLRRVADDGRMLVGRASVVRASRDWIYVQGELEDGEGRAVASMSMHAAIRPVHFEVPEAPPEFEPVSQPSYPTPDPYRRALPADKHAVIERFHDDGCVATFEAIAAGDAPLPPIYALLGIRPVKAEQGRVSTALVASQWLRAVDPSTVGPQYLGVQSVSTGVAAIWTLTPSTSWPAVLECRGTVIDTVPADGRRIIAHAVAERLGEDVARAEIEVLDGDRRLIVAEVIAQFRKRPRERRRQRSRALATVLFTDVVGSTGHAERVGDSAWRGLLEHHQRLVRSRLEETGGREVKTTGDGFLATFQSPSDAVGCACAIRDDARRLGMEIRAGLHAGEIELLGGDVAGIAVHIAARIESLAAPGEVWVSDTVRAMATGASLHFEDAGLRELKGLDEPVRVWSVGPRSG